MGKVPWVLLVLSCRLWAADPLNLYFIDTDGGHATLVVAPSGASLLIDTGNEGYGGRDATRIQAAAKDAGIKKLDYLMLTSFDRGHAGGLANLLTVLPVATFLDAGGDYPESYRTAFGKVKHQVLKAGDSIPMKGLEVHLDSAGAIVVESGKLRFANLADPAWNRGLSLLYWDSEPRVAILNNSARNADAAAWKTVSAMPGLQDVWQVHFAMANGGEANAPDALIANLAEVGDGKYLKVSALADGSFTVFNPRNKFSKTYAAK